MYRVLIIKKEAFWLLDWNSEDNFFQNNHNVHNNKVDISFEVHCSIKIRQSKFDFTRATKVLSSVQNCDGVVNFIAAELQ